MILTLVIAILTFLTLITSIIFFPKLKIKNIKISTYWVIALIGAILMLATVRISFNSAIKSLFSLENAMNPIKILILFFSMTFISIYLEKAGFFKYLASLAASKAKSKQTVFFIILYLLISVLTVFTSNDIVILTFTPFICYFCKNAKINPLPYLIAEFAAANTWSMMLIIGNPTNLYLGSNAGIDFLSYFKVMAIPTMCSGIIEFIILYLIFRKQLSQPLSCETTYSKLENKTETIIGLVHLVICILLLALSNVLKSIGIDLEMWLISFIVAASLLIILLVMSFAQKDKSIQPGKVFKSLPYELIPFVISMFVIVLALQNRGISKNIGDLLGKFNPIFSFGVSSYLVSNLINNIPMSILYSTLPVTGSSTYLHSIYASIIGSNIGAFLTPIGALAGIMFTSLIKDQDVKLSFKQFSQYGIIISVPTLVTALLVLLLIR